jgi:hypothetical protein
MRLPEAHNDESNLNQFNVLADKIKGWTSVDVYTIHRMFVCDLATIHLYEECIRPLEVRLLPYPEHVPNPWGFFASGAQA